MHLKCILLSFCLILKITNVKSIFIPPTAIAKTAKGYVSAIGIIGTYMAVSDQIEDKAGEVNKYVEEFQVYAKELANGLEVEVCRITFV